jgi:FlaA1/EpsC-like NDP-sugar epimerase
VPWQTNIFDSLPAEKPLMQSDRRRSPRHEYVSQEKAAVTQCASVAMKLEDRVAVVTGAGGGIGRAIAWIFQCSAA